MQSTLTLLSLLLISFLLHVCFSDGQTHTLSDQQIIGGTVKSLSGPWEASSPAQLLKMVGNVPGDIASDLYTAGHIGDPIRDINFVTNSSIWAKFTWFYNTSFSLTAQDVSSLSSSTNGADILLVFDGIKMGANIYLNGYLVDTSISQFLRLNYSLRAFQQQFKALAVGQNTLSVMFDPSIPTHGLFAQCSGGWDWAPYTGLNTPDGFTIFSVGIWKDVYLVWVPWVAVMDTVVHTFYTGPYPTEALVAGQHSPFQVDVTLYTYNFATSPITDVVVQVSASWIPGSSPVVQTVVQIPPGYASVPVTSFNATASQIKLWWPTGFGDQPLYTVQVSLTNPATKTAIVDTRQIAFRYATMVTGNDTDPEYVSKNGNTDGSDSFGLMWRINGQAIFNRGANVIPMDNMEGRYSATAHRQMVLSARDGMMNTLRIWGGGVYLPQIFYDTCDEVGILVLHDLMNRGSYLGVPQEVEAYIHQARRLAHHPSIIVWNGCNECGGANRIVPSTVDIIVGEDTSRTIWPSCPSSGWATGVNRLTGHPNGSPLALAPGNGIETHGPYQHGDGWPAVNGDFTNLDLFNPDTPPQEYPSATIGLGQPNMFTSEFGSATWSSFESISATLSPSHWSLHGGMPADHCTGSWANNCQGGNPLAQRNYPCDSIYASYYGKQALGELDEVGDEAFKKQLFKCVLGSALKVKSYIEETRSRNSFGSLVWQLNEIWPTGGWGSLEYGSEVAGQVTGGRWKPIHYWMRRSLFTDVLIACGVRGELGSSLWCYVKNDSPNKLSGQLTFSAVQLSNSQVSVVTQNNSFSLNAGPDALQWLAVNLPTTPPPSSYVLVATLTATNSPQTILGYNTALLAAPANLTGLANFTVSFSVASAPNPDQSVNVVLTKDSSAAALFVTLTTAANGRFSDNAFLMTSSPVTIQFIPFSPLDINSLRSSLRVEHLGNYL